MSEKIGGSLSEAFEKLSEPRVAGRCEHKLLDIVVLAVCAVLTGAESWVEVETFGKAKQERLKTFLELPNGIPSHDTIGRVFAALDGAEFQACFARWVEGLFRVNPGQVIALDGKQVRRSHNKRLGKAAIHMVSAWASTNGIVLGQVKVDEKSNEITAIPELLRLLDVSGCVVTIDAMGCQTEIAQTIRDEKADYVLRVKDNQSHLHQDLQEWFAYADQPDFDPKQVNTARTVNKAHGRIEIRCCQAIADPLAFETIRHYEGWADLQTIARVQRVRRFNGKVETETAFYISSLPNDARRILEATRAHWSIENSCHWVLDVTCSEDDSRVRVGDSPQNMAVLRHLALNILQSDPSKGSLRNKRYRAALDDSFLFALLSQF